MIHYTRVHTHIHTLTQSHKAIELNGNNWIIDDSQNIRAHVWMYICAYLQALIFLSFLSIYLRIYIFILTPLIYWFRQAIFFYLCYISEKLLEGWKAYPILFPYLHFFVEIIPFNMDRSCLLIIVFLIFFYKLFFFV